MSKTKCFALAGEVHLPWCGHPGFDRFQFGRFPTCLEHLGEFVGPIEMIGDSCFSAARNKDELFDSGRLRLLHRILDERFVDDGQHLLGDRLSRGQEAGAEPGYRKHRLAHWPIHRF